MKKLLSILIILAMTLALSSCHRVVSCVRFMVDDEIYDTYIGPSSGIELPTLEDRDGMEFVGWYIMLDGKITIITEDNVDDYFGIFPILTLYAAYSVEVGDDTDTDVGDDGGDTSLPDSGSDNHADNNQNDNDQNGGESSDGDEEDDDNLDHIEPGDPWDDVGGDDEYEDGSNVDSDGWTDL